MGDKWKKCGMSKPLKKFCHMTDMPQLSPKSILVIPKISHPHLWRCIIKHLERGIRHSVDRVRNTLADLWKGCGRVIPVFTEQKLGLASSNISKALEDVRHDVFLVETMPSVDY